MYFYFIFELVRNMDFTNVCPYILLMCVLRTHIKLSIFENIFSRIEKVMTTF